MAQRLNDHLTRMLTAHLAHRLRHPTLDKIDAALSDYFSDCLVITWNIDDVQHVAETHDITHLYANDYRQILLLAEQQINAELGINWDMLWIHMQDYLNGQRPDEGHPQDVPNATSANPQTEGQ